MCIVGPKRRRFSSSKAAGDTAYRTRQKAVKRGPCPRRRHQWTRHAQEKALKRASPRAPTWRCREHCGPTRDCVRVSDEMGGAARGLASHAIVRSSHCRPCIPNVHVNVHVGVPTVHGFCTLKNTWDVHVNCTWDAHGDHHVHRVTRDGTQAPVLDIAWCALHGGACVARASTHVPGGEPS